MKKSVAGSCKDEVERLKLIRRKEGDERELRGQGTRLFETLRVRVLRLLRVGLGVKKRA